MIPRSVQRGVSPARHPLIQVNEPVQQDLTAFIYLKFAKFKRQQFTYVDRLGPIVNFTCWHFNTDNYSWCNKNVFSNSNDTDILHHVPKHWHTKKTCHFVLIGAKSIQSIYCKFRLQITVITHSTIRQTIIIGVTFISRKLAYRCPLYWLFFRWRTTADVSKPQTADCRLPTNSTDKQYLSLGTHFKTVSFQWISCDLGLVCSLRSQSCQVLKFPTSEILAADGAKGTSVLCFLCWRGQKLLGGSGGMLPRKMFEIRWKCTVEFAILVFSCSGGLLREPMLLWSAWANISAYTSHINGWNSCRNKKKMVASEQMEHWLKFSASEGTNSEFMSTSESLKGRITYQECANVWEILVSAWEREITSKCVRLVLNAWNLRALSGLQSAGVNHCFYS